MTDDVQRLRRAATELHQALESAHDLDQDSRTVLEQVLSEVRNALSHEPSGNVMQSTPAAMSLRGLPLRKQLAETAAEFGGSHPTLATTVKSLIEVLTQIGI